MSHKQSLKTPNLSPTKKAQRTNITLGEKLQQRAVKYSEFSGLSIPAILRNGLDKLLKENNF